SEQIVNHPVRRRIVMLLMLTGNAGIVTAVSSLILSFISQRETETLSGKLLLLFGGLAVLWWIANSKWIDRHLSRIIDRALRKYTKLDVRDYASLMHLAADYRLVELHIAPDDWLANRTLKEAELRDEGLVVLGIRRDDGSYLGGPKGDSMVLPGDTLLVYGRIRSVEELDNRRKDYAGDREHRERVREQEAESTAK
ncbi:MAG: TrkA C-terminal domain-containing protein, partial [Thermoanaerobaculia bacterium]|nr:TrkA C-terminal domain-containing protein [Thermoanaerobaculia bacterium]